MAARADTWLAVAPGRRNVSRFRGVDRVSAQRVRRPARRRCFEPVFGVFRPLQASGRLRGPFYPRHPPSSARFLKAAKLAAALRLPVRVLPGQPTTQELAELNELLDLYLHQSMVEAPVEFFHSLLATMFGADSGSLWTILEEDPAEFLHYDASGRAMLPRSSAFDSTGTSFRGFVENHLKSLVEQGAECATCPWQRPCAGYFKWPDPTYSCEGVKPLFSTVQAAADEIGRDLANCTQAKTNLSNLTEGDTA